MGSRAESYSISEKSSFVSSISPTSTYPFFSPSQSTFWNSIRSRSRFTSRYRRLIPGVTQSSILSMSRIRKNKPYGYRGSPLSRGKKKTTRRYHFRVQIVAIFDLAKIATVSRSLWSARNCKKKKRPLAFTFCCNNFFLAWQLIIGDETIILVQSTLFPLRKLQRSLTIIFNRKYIHCLDRRLTFLYSQG